MWTSKRILLLTVAGILFLVGFFLYTFFLGGIDGLSPLPVAFLPDPNHETPPYKEQLIRPPDAKLIKAFGDDCEEIGRVMRIELAPKGLVLSTNVAEVLKDGRVRLEPFSVAVFKEKSNGAFPEINTIRCKEAYLRFDQPIRDPTEMGSHKIIGAELRGDIRASNNRGTPLKSDDLEARVPRGPVFFDEQESRIWSDDFVSLLDTQSQPEPTRINAKGMVLHLTKETPKDKPHGGAGKGTAISGVDQIVLDSNVEMLLWVESNSGFLSGGAEKKDGKAQAKKGMKPAAGEKSRVVIRTQGPFTYDLPKDRARFESPPKTQGRGSALAPDQVIVWREHVQGASTQYDQIVCDLLVLQFRRKQGGAPQTPGSSSTGDREIESAHATAKPGEEVVLSMDTENLAAHGSDLMYYTATPVKTSLTILKGTPMWAVKDAHKITALELHLMGANGKGEGQQGSAKGPGQIDLLDHNSGAKVHQYHAVWKDMLVLTKDHEAERVFDLLTFTGQACFIDDEHHQEMRGDKLQVWLEPPPREEAATQARDKKQAAAEAPRQRPHKVEAFDHVTVRSPDMNVRDCEHLIIRFKDGPSPQLPEMLPPIADSTVKGPVAAARSAGTPATGQAVPVPGSGSGAQVAGAAAPSHSGKEKQANADHKPINLQARRVAAYVLRAGAKNELQEVVTEGNVHVHQDGAKPDDKGIDIKGETLNLVRYAQGDTMVVFGDAREPAQLQLGELFLVGPKVTINQKDNNAEVEGVGAMQLPSNTGLDGGPAKKNDSRLTVHWTNDMFFDGNVANFHGGVVAYQDDASLRCNTMQVTLDRVVSFKEGQKSGQAAKMKSLVCDRKVYVADTTLDANGDLLRYERLVAQQLNVDNEQGPTKAPGPGKVYLLQQGTPDDAPGATPGSKTTPAAAPKPGAEKHELTLTRVDYQGRLFSSTNPKSKIRITNFYDNVEVFHLPATNPDVKIDIDKLPKGGLYLKCEQLKILSKPMPDGKTGQYMRAAKNVSFQSQDMKGHAPLLKYSQPDELVVFEGDATNPVVLYRYRPPNPEPERITGTQILYNRRTGVFTVGGGKEILTNTQ